MDKSLKLDVLDFLVDEKKIERFSFASKAGIHTDFDFDLVHKDENAKEVNAIFRAKMAVTITDKEKDESENKVAKIHLQIQIATFITDIEQVDFDNPAPEHEKLAISVFYPIARSVIADDMAYIKRGYSDLPYTL